MRQERGEECQVQSGEGHLRSHLQLATLLRLSSLHETVSFGWRLRRALSAGLPEAQATLVSLASMVDVPHDS